MLKSENNYENLASIQGQPYGQHYQTIININHQQPNYNLPNEEPREWSQVFPHLSMTPQEVQEFNPFGSSNNYNLTMNFPHHELVPAYQQPSIIVPPNMTLANYSPSRQQSVSNTLQKINSNLKNFQIPLLNTAPTELIIPNSEVTIAPSPNYKSKHTPIINSSSSDSEDEPLPTLERHAAHDMNLSPMKGVAGSPIAELFKREADLNTLAGGPSNRKFINVSPFFRYSQRKAAKLLGVPCSTLSKRWRDATGDKKWPYRSVNKMEKEILSLMQNINHSGQKDPRFEGKLSFLAGKVEEELTPVFVRL